MIYFLRKNNKTLFMLIVLSLSTALHANDLTSHDKIKKLDYATNNYCFIKIITTTNGNTITTEEKLICADGRKNFDEPGYWELFSEFYYRDNNTPEYCRAYARPNHAFKLYGKVCLDKSGRWRVK